MPTELRSLASYNLFYVELKVATTPAVKKSRKPRSRRR